jgi:hypothetical protein
MPRPQTNHSSFLELPPEPDPSKLPRYGDRRLLAQIHHRYWGPVSARTLEKWPLVWRILNGRAISEVRPFLIEAQRRFDAAPAILGGRRGRQIP